LTNLIVNTDLQVLIGKKTLEVKSTKVDKGAAVQNWLSKRTYDFILSMGDDRTDEDVFKVLKEDAISIRVGIAPSRARYYLRNQAEVSRLFEELHSLNKQLTLTEATT
jgi:trehalose 6-phosphate synthase/phosphatase